MKKLVILFITLFLLLTTMSQAIYPIQRKSSNFEINLEMEDIIQDINESLVFYYHNRLMDFGPRYTGSINCRLAGEWIHNEFESMGLYAEFHDWRCAGFESKNIVATLPGSNESSTAIIIFSAHYDCTPDSLGADDDGSGVAAIMAAAKVLSGHSFNHTIQFIAFSGEEVGTYGSFCYAQDAYGREDNIYAVINADMIGYADTSKGGRIINFHCPERSRWIADFASRLSDKYLDLVDIGVETRPNYIGADHQAFSYYGYDGVWIAHHDGYQWANSPEDTPDHINHTYQVKATKFLTALVVELASEPIEVQVMIKTPNEGTFYLFNRPIFKLTFSRLWYLGFRGITVIRGRTVASAEVLSCEEIEKVVFCIDGNFMYWDYEPPYEWEIQGRFAGLFGRHTLKVYTYTTTGKIASDEMDINIRTLNKMY